MPTNLSSWDEPKIRIQEFGSIKIDKKIWKPVTIINRNIFHSWVNKQGVFSLLLIASPAALQRYFGRDRTCEVWTLTKSVEYFEIVKFALWVIRKCKEKTREHYFFPLEHKYWLRESLAFIEPFRLGSKQQVGKLSSISVVIIMTQILSQNWKIAHLKMHESNVKLSDEQ